jgi:hypothetical protein
MIHRATTDTVNLVDSRILPSGNQSPFPIPVMIFFSLLLSSLSRFNEYRWFRQSKFPSFQRQLNLYGFKRLTSGKSGTALYVLFIRPYD